MKRLVQIPGKHLRKAHQEPKDAITEIEDFKRRFIALLDWMKDGEGPDKMHDATHLPELYHKNVSR